MGLGQIKLINFIESQYNKKDFAWGIIKKSKIKEILTRADFP